MNELLTLDNLIQAVAANLIPFIFLIIAVVIAKKTKKGFWILFILGCALRGFTYYTYYNLVRDYKSPYYSTYNQALLRYTLFIFLFIAIPLYIIGKERSKKCVTKSKNTSNDSLGSNQHVKPQTEVSNDQASSKSNTQKAEQTGNRYNVTLPDGSTIWLNEDAFQRYEKGELDLTAPLSPEIMKKLERARRLQRAQMMNGVEENTKPLSNEPVQKNDDCDIDDTAISKLNISDLPPTLRRAFIFVEDEEWEKADEYFEKVLDEEPENAYAYAGKALAEIRVNSLDCISDDEIDRICKTKAFSRAQKYAEGALKDLLDGWQKKASGEKQVVYVEHTEPTPSSVSSGKNKRRTIIAIITCFVVLASIMGLYLKRYFDAKTLASSGDCLSAKESLILPALTKLHDPNLYNYIDAAIMLEKGELDGYRIIRELADSNYSIAVDGLYDAKQLAYRHAVELYRNRQYLKAKDFFKELGMILRCRDYLTLIDAHHHIVGQKTYEDQTNYNRLFFIRGFEDANTVLIDKYYDVYLLGDWETKDRQYYFSMDEDLSVRHNLPCNANSGTYSFSNAVYIINDGKTSSSVFRIIPVDDNAFLAMSYSNWQYYSFFRKT